MARLLERWFETATYLVTTGATVLLIAVSDGPIEKALALAFCAFTAGLAAARLAPHIAEWLGRER